MKKCSIYNTFLELNSDYGLCYNALSDRFLLLKHKAYDILRACDLTFLHDNHIDLFNQLVGINAIVDDAVDEVQQVRDMIRSVDNDDTCFQLHVNPTVDCNFRCWYCYEDHKKGSRMDEKTVKSVKRLIDNILDEHKQLTTFLLSFFGGEPLMYFNSVAKPLIEYATEACNKHDVRLGLSFTTNGYLLTPGMMDFFRDKDVSFQITLDGNRELHNKTRFMKSGQGSFDKIISNIKALAVDGYHITMRINYTADNLASVAAISDEFADLDMKYRDNISVDFQRVWQDDGTAADEEAIDSLVFDDVKLFRSKGLHAYCSKYFNMVKNSCYGCKRNYVLVNFNGDLFQCTARDFATDKRYGYLSEDGRLVYENGLVEQRRSVRFRKHVCEQCRIAPICGGGCAQKAMENIDNEKCPLGYGPKEIDKQVLYRFEDGLLMPK